MSGKPATGGADESWAEMGACEDCFGVKTPDFFREESKGRRLPALPSTCAKRAGYLSTPPPVFH